MKNMNSLIKEFEEALNHTPVLYYLPNSIVILNRDSENGYTEVPNKELIDGPGDSGDFGELFYKKYLLKQEMNFHFIDYYVINEKEEPKFRKALEKLSASCR